MLAIWLWEPDATQEGNDCSIKWVRGPTKDVSTRPADMGTNPERVHGRRRCEGCRVGRIFRSSVERQRCQLRGVPNPSGMVGAFAKFISAVWPPSLRRTAGRGGLTGRSGCSEGLVDRWLAEVKGESANLREGWRLRDHRDPQFETIVSALPTCSFAFKASWHQASGHSEYFLGFGGFAVAPALDGQAGLVQSHDAPRTRWEDST